MFYSNTTIKAKMDLKPPIKLVQFMDPIQFSYSPHRWFQRFRSGVEVVEDAPRSGWPVVENFDKIAELVERCRHSSRRSIGQESSNRYKPLEEAWSH